MPRLWTVAFAGMSVVPAPLLWTERTLEHSSNARTQCLGRHCAGRVRNRGRRWRQRLRSGSLSSASSGQRSSSSIEGDASSSPAEKCHSAAEKVRKQLAADHWLNEHLQPSWWRLCGADADGQFLPLDYVGRLESFEEDWNRIVKLMPGADAKLRSHYTRPLSAANRRTVGNTSVLSDEGRRLFCRSQRSGLHAL